MTTFRYLVTVEADTTEQAVQVMAERIDPDEDYGFAYTITDEPLPEVYDANAEVTYTVHVSGTAIGFKATRPNGRAEYIMLNPSGGSDDGQPNVFVYIGSTGDVTQDQPEHHYDLFES